VEITDDGGIHWSNASVMKMDGRVRPFSSVLGIAALDSTHYAMLLHKPQGENIFLSTEDGGATWKPLHLNDTYADTLFVHAGEYWAFGYEIVDRQNRGGYSVPLALRSADGSNWVRGAKAPNEFTECTAQGCVLYAGTIADLYLDKPHYLAYPADVTLTAQWAIGGNSILRRASRLKANSWKDGSKTHKANTLSTSAAGVGGAQRFGVR
jgi:hypothetical protein